MTLAEARLEVARVWAKALGQWPTGTSSEPAHERLNRLASDMVAGRLTTGQLFGALEPHAPADLAARRAAYFAKKSIPAWIISGTPAGYDGQSSVSSVVSMPKEFRATITVEGV